MPEFAAREFLAAKDARTLALDLLTMSQETFSVVFRKSPMKRVKLRGLKRNALVVLGNEGTIEDLPALTQGLEDPEDVVREYSAWALHALRPKRPS